jgi:hypothetical protein
MQAFADESQQRPIRHPLPEHLQQVRSAHAIEEGHHVKLQDPVRFAFIHPSGQCSHRIVRAASGPEAKRAVHEGLLVYRLQYLAQCVLHYLIFGSRDADRPRLAFLFLGNVHTSDRLMAISLRPQPLVQISQLVLQVLPVLLLRDVVHADRRIAAQPSKRSGQQLLIDQVGERMKPGRRLPFSSFRYLAKSR